jgi:hypothetical protein
MEIKMITYTQEEVNATSYHLGMNLNKLPKTQMLMLMVMYDYNQGWIDLNELEKRMVAIVKESEL